MILLALPGAPGIELGIANALKIDCIEVEHKIFPDGETYIRIPTNVNGEEVIIVQSMFPDQDRRLVELLLTIETCKDLGASKIITVIPYIAYSRQDKRFRDGEPISIKTVLKLLGNVGADALLVVDIHKAESLKYFPGKAVEVTSLTLLGKKVCEKGVENPIILAPDLGALKRAKRVAEELGTEYDYMEKFRDRITGEITIKPKEIDVSGRDVLIIDDIISTGGTIAKTSKIIKSLGARRVLVAAAHSLLIGDAYERIVSSGVEYIYTANTVKRTKALPKLEIVDISSEVILGLKQIL